MRRSYLDEDHGGDLLGGESLGLTEVLNLDHGGTVCVGDLEGPRLDILLDGGIVETTTDKTPVKQCQGPCSRQLFRAAHDMAAATLAVLT